MINFGFIGAGKMAEAIISGALDKSVLKKNEIFAYEINPERKKYISEKYAVTFVDLKLLFLNTKFILIAVKPQNILDLLQEIKGFVTPEHTLISILAGTKMQTFQKELGKNCNLVRVMPNTPALVKKGMSALAFSDSISQAAKDFVLQVFQGIGETIEVSESQIDMVTALSGSGPAYFYYLADVFAKQGSKELGYDKALHLIAQTMIGAGEMLKKSGKLPDELIKDVSSPGGTTVAGLAKLQVQELENTIASTVKAAHQRSIELGKIK